MRKADMAYPRLCRAAYLPWLIRSVISIASLISLLPLI